MDYSKKLNPFTGRFDYIADETSFHVKDPVNTYNDLPIIGNKENDMRFVKDTDKAYVWGIESASGNLSDWKLVDTIRSESEIKTISKTDTDIADAITKKHTQNTDEYLTTQVTKVLYVDGNRTDSYTENGSVTKPFKTIQSAIDISSGATLIKITPGTYTENIAMKAGIILEGVRGAVTITSSSGDTILIDSISSVTLKDLQITNTDPTMKAGIKFVNATGASNKFYNCSITSLGRSIDALNTVGIHCFTCYLYGTLYLDNVTSASFTNHGWLAETSGLETLLQIKNSSQIVFSNTFAIMANNAKAIVVDNSNSKIMISPQVIVNSNNNDCIELKNTSTLIMQGGGIGSGAGKKDLIIDATSYVLVKDVYYDTTKLQLANPLINIQKQDFAWQQVYDPAGTNLSSKDVQSAITELDTNKSKKSVVFTNTIELQANGANFETINYALAEQFVQAIVSFKPSSGTYSGQWINGEGVLTIVYHDTDNIRLYNDSGNNIAIGDAKIIIQK